MNTVTLIGTDIASEVAIDAKELHSWADSTYLIDAECDYTTDWDRGLSTSTIELIPNRLRVKHESYDNISMDYYSVEIMSEFDWADVTDVDGPWYADLRALIHAADSEENEDQANYVQHLREHWTQTKQA